MAKRIIKKPNIDLEVKKGIAWAVHVFTTCGIVAGFLALVEVLNNDPVKAFMWLGIALFVDGIDGSLARKAKVSEYTPNFDGGSLDYVIDFFTYVAVPAVMVYWFEMVPLDWIFAGSTWSLVAAATIMAVSCYTFANVGMKSEDYYFVGFPAIWNVVVLYFYVLDTGWLVNGITIIILSILTFIPIKFVHPAARDPLAQHHNSHDRPVGGHDAFAGDQQQGQGSDRRNLHDRTLDLDCRFALFCLDFPVADLRSGRPGPHGRERPTTQLDFRWDNFL